ncbi:MAG: sensor histidine kinase [Rhodoglobus sp.]
MRWGSRPTALDILMVLVGLGVGILADLGAIERGERSVDLGVVLAVLACVSVLWRRRWPFAIALIATILSGFIPLAGGAAIVTLFSLAAHRPVRQAIPVGLWGIAIACARALFTPADGSWDSVATIVIVAVAAAIAIGWGGLVRNRRELLVSLAQLATVAEETQRARVDSARAAERELLAREMHDVLAHRMSLISIHAGAMEFRTDASPDEVRRAAGVVRAGVHQMQVDLRDVIDMLRDEADRDTTAPMISLGSVKELFEQSEQAGSPVHATVDIHGDMDDVPGVVGRAAYRVIQEGLTNARKHGGAVPVSVTIRGSAGSDLVVIVEQPCGHASVRDSRTGSGLTGLAERVLLAGGVLDHRITQGNFVLTATLPWEKSE